MMRAQAWRCIALTLAVVLSARADTVQMGGRTYTVVRECPDAEYDFSLTVAPEAQGEALKAFDLLFALTPDGTRAYRLRCSGREAALSRVGPEGAVPLASGRLRGESKSRRVSVRRRAHVLSVEVEGADPLEALDAALASGRTAIAPIGQSIRLADWQYQPIAPLHWTDGFTRLPTEKGEWEALRGTWRLRTVQESELKHPEREGKPLEPQRSANFFYFTGVADPASGDALGVVGHAFWDRYRLEASLQAPVLPVPQAAGSAVGVAFYVRDGANYYLLRWWLTAARLVPQPIELVRVEDGRETVLARAAVPGAAGQWYRLAVVADGARLRAEVDGRPVLDVLDGAWTRGRIGLYQLRADGALFDDVECSSILTYDFDTASAYAMSRPEQEGRWRFGEERASGPPGAPPKGVFEFAGGGLLGGRGDGLCWIGDAAWADYVLEGRVAAPESGSAVGLAAADADGRMLVLRLARADGAHAPVAELAFRDAKGQETLLASGPVPAGGGERGLLLDLHQPGRAEGYVDGFLAVRAAHGLARNRRPGLYARNAKQVAFSGVRVAFARREDVGATVDVALFAQDRYMADWASDRMAWVAEKPGSSRHWHKSDFFGRCELGVPLLGPFTAYLASEERSTEDCYTLRAEGPAGQRPARVTLLRRGGVVAEAALPAGDAGALRVLRDGAYLWAVLGADEVLSFRDDEPLRGTQIGIEAAEPLIAGLQVRQFNVKDDIFQRAPVDWRQVGTWEVTNRFTCDPRWSWLSGTQWDGLAAIWNKTAFPGDVTVEFYAGMRMASGMGMNYPRVGEINATVACDLGDLSSGYSAVFAGWDPEWTGRWSFLTRQASRVAATDRELVPLNRFREPGSRPIPVAWDPGGRPIHGAWYYIKVRKRGDTVRCYFDNVPVMEFRDPRPLAGRYVAIWTQSDSIMVARVRISYERKSDPDFEVVALPTEGSALAFAVRDEAPAGRSALAASRTHPGALCDFEHYFDGWQPADGDQGARLVLDERSPGSGSRSLRLINDNAGGTFGAVLPLRGLLPFLVSDLRFKYRITPDVKVNLYLTIGDMPCYVHFTGPDEPTGGLIRLGEIADVRADGQWHEAQFALADAVLRFHAAQARAGARYAGRAFAQSDLAAWRADELRIGNYHEGYLRAGFGGNGPGATWWLDDFRLVSAGGEDVRFTWKPSAEGSAFVGSFTFGAPQTPQGDALPGLAQLQFKADRPGLWYFNLREVLPDGTALFPRHHPVIVDSGFVGLAGEAAASAAEPTAWGGEPMALALDNVAAGNVALGAARLTINDREAALRPGVLRFEPNGARLVVDVSRLDPVPRFGDGTTVTFGVYLPKYMTTEVGAGVAQGTWLRWTRRYALAADRTPPGRVRLADRPLTDDFEDGFLTVEGTDPMTAVWWDESSAASGAASLRVVATRLTSPMALVLTAGGLDAGRYPILSFDYRLSPAARLDMALATAAGERVIRMSDDHAEPTLVGHVPNLVADGTWRRAEVDLRRLLENDAAGANALRIQRITFADRGYRAAAPGTWYALDDLSAVPVVSAAAGVRLSLRASDPGGIAGYSFAWSADPQEIPPETVLLTESEVTVKEVPEGDIYFHVRACDRAGNWGPASHYRFLTDNSPPQIVWDPGDAVLGEVLRIRVEDAGPAGIDYSSVRVEVDGHPLTAGQDAGAWDPKRGILTWQWAAGETRHVPARPDGSTVSLVVKGLRDYAGNAAPETPHTLKVVHAADKTPPTPPAVSSDSGELLSFDTFGADLGQWRAHQPEQYTELSRVVREGRDHCLVVRNKNTVSYGAYARSAPYDLRKHPLIAFDYRFPRGILAHLVVNVDGQVYSISLTGHRTGYRQAGEVKGIQADDRWHHARVDVLEHVRGLHPAGAKFEVRWLFIGNMMNQSRPNEEFFLDNFAFYGPSTGAPRLRWAAQDATGIRGYSLVIDAQPDTIPDTTVDVDGPSAELKDVPVGDAYLHIRACDGAGNWGAASHVPLRITPPQAPAPDKAPEATAG